MPLWRLVFKIMFCPHEQRMRFFSSHSRVRCLRSLPFLDSIMSRALSTSPRGKYAGTGTAIHSSLGAGTLFTVLRYRGVPSEEIERFCECLCRFLPYPQTP